MIRIVLDTNVIVSAIIGRKYSPSKEIFDSLGNHRLSLATSIEILQEVEEVINRKHVVKYHGYGQERRSKIIVELAKLSSIVPGKVLVEKVTEDSDDNKILACATEAKASYIITGDRHLLKLKKFEGIKIVTPRKFKEILEKQID